VVRPDVELRRCLPDLRKTKVGVGHLQVVIPAFKRKELLTPPKLIRATVEDNARTGESEGPVKDEELRAQKQSLTGLDCSVRHIRNLPRLPRTPGPGAALRHFGGMLHLADNTVKA
jgi:hypothetical protein